MDYYLIFENIILEFTSMCKELNLNHNLKHLNQRVNDKKAKIIGFIESDPGLKKRIEKIYKEDIKLYNKIKKQKENNG